MKRFAVLILLVFSIPLYASHIVGGEIEFLHVNGFTYRINLIYYYDVVNGQLGDPQTAEPNLILGIFRKKDDAFMMQVTLDWLYKTRVPYTQPECSSGEIISDKIIYTNVFTFDGTQFNDPDGYYIMWARCCRNYFITNIISQDPNKGGLGAGQTFYLEFPPMMINGKQFINSSPKDFPALNDYACPTKPYYVDFAGTDPDGDSLAYTLITPLSTVSAIALPPITSRPYPEVTWSSGFDLQHIVNGNPRLPDYPDLNISPAGFLRVTPRPSSLGLYVFAVRVEEYRNKQKIGETRRDFQMLVTDCRLSAPPEISGKQLNAATFISDEITVHFANTVTDNDRCFLVSVSDPDADREADKFSEFIKLRIIPMNFIPKGVDLQSMLPIPDFGYIIGGGRGPGNIQFRICLPQCPFLPDKPYQLGVIALDDACSLPLMDTLRVNVQIDPPDNESPRFNLPNPKIVRVNEGMQDSWTFEAHDPDNDQMVFRTLTKGFSLDKAGMKVNVNQNDPGVLKGRFSWDAFCDIYDFTKQTNFIVKLIADDLDKCDINPPDTLVYDLTVVLPPYPEPFIDTDITTDPDEVEVSGIEKKIFDSWTFNVTARDIVSDAEVTIRMEGDGFNPSGYGMQFTKKSGVGTVTSPFRWDLLCKSFNLEERDEFNIGFVAVDSLNKCRVRQIDSLVVKVKVLKPDNGSPKISIINLSNDVIYENGNAIVSPGQELNLQFNLTDTDIAPIDSLHITMLENGGDGKPEGWAWQDVGGPSVLTGTFLWAPLCSIFTDGENRDLYERNYYFNFQYGDNRCFNAAMDTITLNVKVKDIESGGFEHEPPNVFTPNGDGVNDFYAMMRRDEVGDLVTVLPPDNCQGVFENIRIYNRWGKQVFTSGDRDFKWYGLNEAAGVYFYHVVFTNKEFKGTVSLRD